MSKQNEMQDIENTTFKLSQPLMVNGDPITEIPYSFEGITAKDHVKVERDLKGKGVLVMAAQFDGEYLINIFARAVSKATTSVTLSDILRVSLKDCVKIENLVRSFFYREDETEESTQIPSTDTVLLSQE